MGQYKTVHNFRNRFILSVTFISRTYYILRVFHFSQSKSASMVKKRMFIKKKKRKGFPFLLNSDSLSTVSRMYGCVLRLSACWQSRKAHFLPVTQVCVCVCPSLVI